MDTLIGNFAKSLQSGSGYDLSMTLSPVAPASDPNRLYNFHRSTNAAHAQRDIKTKILHNTSSPFRLSTEEATGWAEVYYTYWKAVGEILSADEAARNGAKVGRF
jgi:hypothetical protein